MSALNMFLVFFHELLVSGICSRNPPGRIPGRGHLLLDPELKVLLTCPVFTETDSRQWGNREDDRRNADVIWSLMVSLQEVCRDERFLGPSGNRADQELHRRCS